MPPTPPILQVLLRASVHCCLNKSEVFSDCNCIWLRLKQSHRLKAVHIPLWACFSDLSVQRVFLGLRTWHNMTCCQVSKHGVSGDETGEQTGNKLKMDFYFSCFFFLLPCPSICSSPFCNFNHSVWVLNTNENRDWTLASAFRHVWPWLMFFSCRQEEIVSVIIR